MWIVLCVCVCAFMCLLFKRTCCLRVYLRENAECQKRFSASRFFEKLCILSTSPCWKFHFLTFRRKSRTECVTSAPHASSRATVSCVSRWGESMHR